MTAAENKIVNMMIEAYTTVYGIDKWNSLTATEQHDVIMILVNESMNMIG